MKVEKLIQILSTVDPDLDVHLCIVPDDAWTHRGNTPVLAEEFVLVEDFQQDGSPRLMLSNFCLVGKLEDEPCLS